MAVMTGVPEHDLTFRKPAELNWYMLQPEQAHLAALSAPTEMPT